MHAFTLVNRSPNSVNFQLNDDQRTIERWSEQSIELAHHDRLLVGDEVFRFDSLGGFPFLVFNSDVHLSSSTKKVFLLYHGANTVENVKEAIYSRANGLEVDVWMDESNKAWVSHSEEKELSFESWIAELLKYDLSTLKLILFDIKKAEKLEAFQELIRAKLGAIQTIVYSTRDVEHAGMFNSIKNKLTLGEYLCIDEENDIEKVVGFYREMGIKRSWYGNGLFSLGPDLNVIHESLKKAAEFRKRSEIISHTVGWTVQLETSFRQYFYEDDVDALIVEPNSIRSAVEMVRKSPWLELI